MTPEQMEAALALLPATEREEFERLLAADVEDVIWEPQVGPQMIAFESAADITGYGGSAGSGKTDLAAGLILREHKRSLFIRREKAQTQGVVQRLAELLADTNGYSGQQSRWDLPGGRLLELGGLDNPGDERRWQGRPHDLLCVGAGTLVWMADGSRRAIETLRVGDMVDTLAGPRRVTQTMRSEKQAVRVTALDDKGNVLGSQVQGTTHALLGYVPCPAGPFLPTPPHCARKCEESCAMTCATQPGLPASRSEGPPPTAVSVQGAELLLSWQATPCDTGYRVLENAPATSSETRTTPAPPALSPRVPKARCALVLPTADAQDSAHTRSPRRWSYLHPYSKEKRCTARGLRVASLLCSDAGFLTLFDLTVEGENHYITNCGFVNKNCFDEAAELREAQVRFIMGWNRSADPAQRCRVLMTFNPPTTVDGRWIVSFFAPWIDKTHDMYPTPGGTLLWVYMHVEPGKEGREVFLPTAHGPTPFRIVNGERVYDIPADAKAEDIITPRSRTFIPARLTDNAYLADSGYKAMLQALPEPARSQMLYGDFSAGVTDDPWQVIPTAWIAAAQTRWREPVRRGEMLALGVDVARGGKDDSVIVARHKHDGSEWWFDRPLVYPGTATPDGHTLAAQVMAARRDDAPIALDVIGVGASPYDVLRGVVQAHGVNMSASPTRSAAGGVLLFLNTRTQLWWTVRELLDPANNHGVCLPPDPRLARELATPRWSMSGKTIQVESRDNIIARGGKSPDVATALMLACMEIPKRAALAAAGGRAEVLSYDPLRGM